MSIVTVFKDSDTLIFSTDSRMMKGNYSGVDCDTQQKIFQVGPGTFIATSGRKMASEFQVARARELAVELGTTDIQAIGAAVEKETLSFLPVLVKRLSQEPDETTRQAVAGNIMLHGCMLVGRDSGGKLGYVRHEYRVQADGTISCETETYFDAPRKVTCIAGTPAALMAKIANKFMWDAATWRDPLEAVSLRWLELVKAATPEIGGSWQVVRLDTAGAHWISQPPVVDDASQTAAGTCNATVSFTAPIIKVTAGSLVIDLAAAISSPVGTITGTMVSHVSGGVTTDAILTSAYAVMACTGSGTSGQNSYISQAGFYTSNGGSTDAFLGPSELMVTGLPSSNPGAGSKKFWYDPSDGNRVKFAA
jgi:hypothetical protein